MLNHKSSVLSEEDLFKVPFGPSIPWGDFRSAYPEVEKEMNGTCVENCLLFYYSLNPVNITYEFNDEDAENDFADLIGLDLFNISTGETENELTYRTHENVTYQLNSLKAFFNDTSADDVTEDDTKTSSSKELKKKRRKQKILARGPTIGNIINVNDNIEKTI